ncbi:MAG: ATP synthase F1 subunit delta [Nitrolancea sp.]
MSVGGAAKRYAQAAFDVAKEHGQLDDWEQELAKISATLQNPQAEEFFVHPAVPPEAKQAALRTLAAGEDQKYVRNLLLLLLERKRLQQLPQIVEVFHEMVLQDRGVVIADVTTAVELEAAEADKVRERLTQMVGKVVQIRTHVNPDIIGGIVIRMGDTLIDGSVRTQLRQLRQSMAR